VGRGTSHPGAPGAGERRPDPPPQTGNAMISEIRYAAVNGARLGYQVHSEGSGKPPAIFAHGYSGRSTAMRAYQDVLAALAKDFTVYALDLRGHGASASEIDGWSIEAATDDIEVFARQLDLVGALYIGHSFGGFTGLYSEVRHPGVFSGLCLITPGAAGNSGRLDPNAGAVMIEHGKDRQLLEGAFMASYAEPANGISHVEAIMLMDRSVHAAFFPSFARLSILDRIGDIEIPVLLLAGAKDTVITLASLHETALALPRCKEVVFTTEGHAMPIDSPDLTAREIIAFWTHDVRNPAAAPRPRLETAD
jgi:pimeloyl-ACP methyl ester carboxylesterase